MGAALKSLAMWTEFQMQRAALRSAEQKRRLDGAEQQEALIAGYAGQMTAKGNQWLSKDEGCPAYLMGGAQQFQGTIQTVLEAQRITVENLRRTHQNSLHMVQDAQRDARKIAHLTVQQASMAKKAADHDEQKRHDDLIGRKLGGQR